MHQVHDYLREWMESLGMQVSIDAIGNIRGLRPAPDGANSRRLLIGSHLDTVPNAGAFDGILGVVIGTALIERLGGKALPFAIEVIGFSEEEGVRFGVPFLGSRALVGRLDDALLQTTDKDGITVTDAIRHFGLNAAEIGNALAHPCAFAYLEFHIEQGPVLEHLDEPLGVVTSIVGLSRYTVCFIGRAAHAGTTPMHLRRDALAAAAEWISSVEAEVNSTAGLVATAGAIHSEPQAANVISGFVRMSLDVRHASDESRNKAAARFLERGAEIAQRRKLEFRAELQLDQPTVPMDAALVSAAQRAVLKTGCKAPLMTSGAGHDAMIVAQKLPAAMIFLRSPGGVSHHPDENVLPEDVELALTAGMNLISELATG